MSDQDPFEAPRSDLEDERAPYTGSVGLGIVLAGVVMFAGTFAVGAMLRFIPGGDGLLVAFFLLSAPALAIGFGIRGHSRTAKGLWIGFALVLGLLLLLVGLVLWMCSGTHF